MISIIAAYGENRVIGNGNKLPWHLPNDLKHFKNITTGKTIVMGRFTYESIGRPLPNRKNVVLTHDKTYHADGITIVHQLDDIFHLGDVMIIGGASIYKQFLPYADHLYLTEIHHSFLGDAYFPDWDQQQFLMLASEKGRVDEQNPYSHTFYHYQKK